MIRCLGPYDGVGTAVGDDAVPDRPAYRPGLACPLTTTVCPFLCTGTAFVMPGSVTVSVMFFGAPFRSRIVNARSDVNEAASGVSVSRAATRNPTRNVAAARSTADAVFASLLTLLRHHHGQ